MRLWTVLLCSFTLYVTILLFFYVTRRQWSSEDHVGAFEPAWWVWSNQEYQSCHGNKPHRHFGFCSFATRTYWQEDWVSTTQWGGKRASKTSFHCSFLRQLISQSPSQCLFVALTKLEHFFPVLRLTEPVLFFVFSLVCNFIFLWLTLLHRQDWTS